MEWFCRKGLDLEAQGAAVYIVGEILNIVVIHTAPIIAKQVIFVQKGRDAVNPFSSS